MNVSTQQLVEAIRQLSSGFRDGNMIRDAEEFERKAIFFEERNGDDSEEVLQQLDGLISASSSVKGLQDMCPPNADFAAWYGVVKGVHEAATELRKANAAD